MKKLYCVNRGKYRKFQKCKTSYILGKALDFLLFTVTARMKMKKYLKKNNQLRF